MLLELQVCLAGLKTVITVCCNTKKQNQSLYGVLNRLPKLQQLANRSSIICYYWYQLQNG